MVKAYGTAAVMTTVWDPDRDGQTYRSMSEQKTQK